MEMLHNLWMSIPRKWRRRILFWLVSFLFGLLITWIWDIGTLLVILLVISLVASLLRIGGAERWALEQYRGRIRGMMIFALLPAAWEATSILDFVLVLLIMVIIWVRFEQIPKRWSRIR